MITKGGVTPIGTASTATTGVKMRSSGQGTFEGSVKRSNRENGATLLRNAVIFDRSRSEASHCACASAYGQLVKDENWGRSSGHGQFSAVKYLDPGRSCGHSDYWSNPPLLLNVVDAPSK